MGKHNRRKIELSLGFRVMDLALRKLPTFRRKGHCRSSAQSNKLLPHEFSGEFISFSSFIPIKVFKISFASGWPLQLRLEQQTFPPTRVFFLSLLFSIQNSCEFIKFTVPSDRNTCPWQRTARLECIKEESFPTTAHQLNGTRCEWPHSGAFRWSII